MWELLRPGIESLPPALAGEFLTTGAPRKLLAHLKMTTLVFHFVWLCVHSLSRVWLFAALWTVGRRAPLSVGSPRQEYWSGLPFPSPGRGVSSWPRDETPVSVSPASAGGFCATTAPWAAPWATHPSPRNRLCFTPTVSVAVKCAPQPQPQPHVSLFTRMSFSLGQIVRNGIAGAKWLMGDPFPPCCQIASQLVLPIGPPNYVCARETRASFLSRRGRCSSSPTFSLRLTDLKRRQRLL